MAEMSIDDCITWHKIRLEFDLDEIERAAITGTVTYLTRLKHLQEKIEATENLLREENSRICHDPGYTTTHWANCKRIDDLSSIKSYLSGDTDPLLKLAGEDK